MGLCHAPCCDVLNGSSGLFLYTWPDISGIEIRTMSIFPRAFPLLLCSLLISACGGGGGGGSSTPPPANNGTPPPVADTDLDWDDGNWDQEDWQ